MSDIYGGDFQENALKKINYTEKPIGDQESTSPSVEDSAA
jgi:hypothetical protein